MHGVRVSLASPGTTAGGAGSVGGATINSEEFLKFGSDQNKFIQQHIELTCVTSRKIFVLARILSILEGQQYGPPSQAR